MYKKVIFGIIIYILLGWLLCHIDPYENYTWYSGIWHGVFFVPNVLKNFIWHTPCKATFYTTGYLAFYCIFSIISILSCLCLNEYKNKRDENRQILNQNQKK